MANGVIADRKSPDPFSFLSPTIQLSAADRLRVERGETIVNIVPAKGHEIAFVGVTLTWMSPE